MAEISASLIEEIEKLNAKKAEVTTKVQLIEQQLAELSKEIKSKGYDPDKLAETVQQLADFEKAFVEKAGPIVAQTKEELYKLENKEFQVEEFPGFETQQKQVPDNDFGF